MYISSKCFGSGPGGESDSPPQEANTKTAQIDKQVPRIGGSEPTTPAPSELASRTMATLLAVDVGNTNTVLGVFVEGQLVAHWRIQTVAGRTSDEYAVLLKTLLALDGTAGTIDA